MNFKVLSTSPTFGYYVPEPVEYLKEHGYRLELIPQGKKLSEKELIDSIRDCDAIIVGLEKIDASVIQASQKLKIIAKHGAGVDNIDINTASAVGIAVIAAPGANSDAVADLTFGLFLSLARNIPMADHAIREGNWPRIIGTQVSGKVLGIIGLGQIGKKVAKRASGFDMKVQAYDVAYDTSFIQKYGITCLPLEELLAESDFLSIHIPLTPSTYKLIGIRELQIIKKGAFLVNTSRGDIIDEVALEQALKDGRIKAAALDVFVEEPPKGSHLLELGNVILTPHMGGYTFEALKETGMICVRGIVDFIEGNRPEYLQNPEILTNITSRTKFVDR